MGIIVNTLKVTLIASMLNIFMLPIKFKPVINYDYKSHVVEIPDMVDISQLNRLRDFTSSDISGFHRRGSKDKDTNASFSTCLIANFNDEIYNILDPVWSKYSNSLSFIEPYEIKSYLEGDKFDYHQDGYVNLDINSDRKLLLIVQMSDPSEYDGGDLVVGDYVCTKQQGSAVLFPASIYHCITPVTRGERFSLIGHGWGPYHI